MDMITVSAKTVDDAITKALIQLEVTSDRLYYEVVEKGSSGFLGIGAKPAVIRACKKDEKEKEDAVAAASVKKETAPKKEIAAAPVKQETAAVKDERPKESKQNHGEIEAEVREFLTQIFQSMNMDVELTITMDEKEKEMTVEMAGDGMGILIGKRGQTLDSLQYLVSLVVNKNSEGYIRVKLDTENYRARRKETLETLARNIAYKVKRTKRPVSLEPMNPYERRIIHSALQSDKYVITRSEGEEPFRHVVICLKRESGKRDRY